MRTILLLPVAFGFSPRWVQLDAALQTPSPLRQLYVMSWTPGEGAFRVAGFFLPKGVDPALRVRALALHGSPNLLVEEVDGQGVCVSDVGVSTYAMLGLLAYPVVVRPNLVHALLERQTEAQAFPSAIHLAVENVSDAPLWEAGAAST